VEPGRGVRARRAAIVPGIRRESRIEVQLAGILGSCGNVLLHPLRRDAAIFARPENLLGLLGRRDYL